MKFIRTKFLLVILFVTACSPNSYQLHINSTYSSSYKKSTNKNTNIFSKIQEDSTVEFSGIYSNKKIFLDKYPVFRLFNEQSGFFSIPLTDSLNCQTNVLLKIKGKIAPVPHRYPKIKKLSYFKQLSVSSFEVVNDIENIKRIVDQEYQKIRGDLQKKITPKGSKLLLTHSPDWNIWYKDIESKFIFTFHQYDLMYAADIEFIVDVSSERITDVFAREWFKGE